MECQCSIRGCSASAHPGTRLCSAHLDQIDIAYEDAKENASSDEESPDPYDILVEQYVSEIGVSDQMRSLTLSLIEGGARDAKVSFPDLKVIPDGCFEQLVSFLAVSVVSAVIQERAHLLARMKLFSDCLTSKEAEGIQKAIDEELKSLLPPTNSPEL